MTQTATPPTETAVSTLYQRIEAKLGIEHVRSDGDLAALVERRLPVRSIVSLTKHGLAVGMQIRMLLLRRLEIV